MDRDILADEFPEGLYFKLAHVGINTADEAESRRTAEFLARMFCTRTVKGNNSNFVSDMFEVMKRPGRGAHGHVGMLTNSVAGAVAYLRTLGLEPDMSSAKYEEDGTLRFVFLKDEIAGYAFHLKLEK